MSSGVIQTRPSRPARILLLAVALAIGIATLIPARPTQHPPPMFCIVCGSLGGIDVVLNVVLFIPLGAALVLNGMSVRRAIVACLASTLGIEALQFSVVAGRDASIGDLVTNTSGGMLGALFVAHWRRWLLPSSTLALALSIASAVAFSFVTASTAELLEPRRRRLALWGQLGPQEHPSFAPYRGDVHRFTVGGVDIPYNRVPADDLERLYAHWVQPGGEAEITTGETADGIAAIARLGSSVEEVYFLGEDGHDLLFRTTLEASRWRFRVPSVRLEGAFRRPGERMTVTGAIADHGWSIGARRVDSEMVRHIPFAVSLGWAMLLPFDYPLGTHYRWLCAVWLAALMVPCGYWTMMAAHRVRGEATDRGRWLALLVPLGGLTIGIAGVAARYSLHAPHWSEWTGALMGSAIGALLAWGVVRFTGAEGADEARTRA